MISLIYIIITLGITIFIHEFGHFISAKKLGIKVERFSIGWGPKLFSFKKGETEYIISWLLLLGGYVKLAGETIEEAEKLGEDAFLNQHPYKKIIVAISGVLQNYILAILLLFIVFLVGTETLKPVIGEVKKGYPAYNAGLKKGDEIIAINGEKVKYWEDVSKIIMKNKDKELILKIKRQDNIFTVKIIPKAEETENVLKEKIKRYIIGITPRGDTIKKQYGVLEAFENAIIQSWNITTLTIKAIYKMITRKIEADIAGPIGVFHITWKVAQTGFINLLFLVALININLVIVNLIPLLPFDGGLVVLFLIEWIIGKKVPKNVQETLMEIGWVFIIFLVVFATYKDILRLIKGGY